MSEQAGAGTGSAAGNDSPHRGAHPERDATEQQEQTEAGKAALAGDVGPGGGAAGADAPDEHALLPDTPDTADGPA